MPRFETEMRTLKGWSSDCDERCGLCCLCQPELLPEEETYFQRHHSKALARKTRPHKHTALALKKGRGSCVLLQDRRCSDYANRPHFCRMFPLHFHVGERLSVELDLSCRVAWQEGGVPAEEEAARLLRSNEDRVEETLRRSSSVYQEFRSNCEAAGVWAEPEGLREQVRSHLRSFKDFRFLGELMLMANDDLDFSLEDVNTHQADFELEELEEAAREAALNSMDSSDPVGVPVYCAPDWSWNLYMASPEGVEWKVLDDDGDLQHRGFASAEQVGLLPLTPEGEEELLRYVAILNERDSVMGNACHLVDLYGYADHLSNAYFGVLAVAVMDLLWRAAMLSHFHGYEMDREGVREAVIFFDMDRLDAPTIGAFI